MSNRWNLTGCLLVSASLCGIACATQSPEPRCPPSASEERLAGVQPNAIKRALAEDPIPGQLSWFELEFKPFVFSGEAFPKPDFRYPHTVRQAVGSYKMETTYYDKDFQQVSAPAAPGRYGAVARITFDSGVTVDRYYTLYKQPAALSGLDWWQWAAETTDRDVTDKEAPIALDLPSQLGIKPEVARANARYINTFLRFGFYEDLQRRPYAARLMAGLYEGTAERVGSTDDVIARDRRWWINLKRRLYGIDTQRAVAFGPSRVRTQVPILRPGTPAEAGMKDAVTTELDQVFNAWVKSSNEPFGVALARNGVLFYHKAFGAGERRATVETRSHIASINKTMTGILTLMLVENGHLKLDDEISKYLPGLAAARTDKPITIRHLLTHTSGLPDLTLDEAHDLEELVKLFFPTIQVGANFDYTETGYSLLGHIMELMSGKTTPEFFEEQLLKPLGLTGTEVRGAASAAWSTPLDLAKLGQLVLNGGSYGEFRYYGDALTAEALPQPLSRVIGRETGDVGRGAGLHSYSLVAPTRKTATLREIDRNRSFGFGNVVGHGAVSGTTFAIDLDNRLVIAIARNQEGSHFQENQAQFVEVLGRNIKR